MQKQIKEKMFKQIILKSGRERSLINRHPWVFSGAVKELPKASNGEIVEVLSNKNELLGYGFFSPNSQITCRVFEFTNEIISINKKFWLKKIEAAFELRKQFINQTQTNIFRLAHAEGDFFPGVIIDIYNKTAVCQILIKGVELIKEDIFYALNKLGFANIYLKTKQNTQLLEGVSEGNCWIAEKTLMPLTATENEIDFYIDVEQGQKTGFFIDQRENRKMLGKLSDEKNVLNTFSYSGGFSLYALKGGAKCVHSVDSSKDAIELCNKNVELNNFKNHQSFTEDCFLFLKNCQENFYDIIVIDPPAFAKHSRSVKNAARGYKNLNMLGINKIKPGGLIFTFSCSQHIDKDLFRKIIFGAAADCKKNVRVLRQLSQPDDHPINIFHPEGEYLKGLLLYVE